MPSGELKKEPVMIFAPTNVPPYRSYSNLSATIEPYGNYADLARPPRVTVRTHDDLTATIDP